MKNNDKNDPIDNWVTMQTRNFMDVMGVCEMTYNHSLLNALVGFPGAGKSTALKHFLAGNKHAHYLQMDKAMRPKDFYVELLKLMGVYDYNYSLRVKQLADKFQKVISDGGKKVVLLLDDCGLIESSWMQYFQSVYEKCHPNLGILLVGTSQFKDDFEHAVKQNRPGLPELSSRILKWVELQKPTAGEIVSVAKANGINNPAQLDELAKACQDYRKLKLAITEIRINQLNKDGGPGSSQK